jgi:hypothetical protein
MELDGVPVERCASFVGTAEVLQQVQTVNRRR